MKKKKPVRKTGGLVPGKGWKRFNTVKQAKIGGSVATIPVYKHHTCDFWTCDAVIFDMSCNVFANTEYK